MFKFLFRKKEVVQEKVEPRKRSVQLRIYLQNGKYFYYAFRDLEDAAFEKKLEELRLEVSRIQNEINHSYLTVKILNDGLIRNSQFVYADIEYDQ